MINLTFRCPVCAHGGLDEDPSFSTFEICPSCGVEFGLGDATIRPEDKDARILKLRGEWQSRGAKCGNWFNGQIVGPCEVCAKSEATDGNK